MFLKIGTRGSKLALRQAQIVAEAIAHAQQGESSEFASNHPSPPTAALAAPSNPTEYGAAYLSPQQPTTTAAEYITSAASTTPYPGIVIQPIQTSGDLQQNRSILELGGRGIFSKEIEQQLIAGTIDIAVHSFKDMPAQSPPELCIAALLPREDPRDAIISPQYSALSAIPYAAKIGTSSLRRQLFLQNLRSDLQCCDIRGNIDSRIEKIETEGYAAIILAAAGLKRLTLTTHIKQYLSLDECIPAAGQGIIAVQCRRDDLATIALLAKIHDPFTGICGGSERALMNYVEGSCKIPFAAYAKLTENGEAIELSAMLARPISKDNVPETQVHHSIRNPQSLAPILDPQVQIIQHNSGYFRKKAIDGSNGEVTYRYQKATLMSRLAPQDFAIINTPHKRNINSVNAEQRQIYSTAPQQASRQIRAHHQPPNAQPPQAVHGSQPLWLQTSTPGTFDLAFPISSGQKIALEMAKILGCIAL